MTAINGATGATILVREGTQLENLFGRGVCGLPDLTGDGLGEFCIGIPHHDGVASNSGRHLVYAMGASSSCGLFTRGEAIQNGSLGLVHTGLPASPSLVLLDVSAGPTTLPTYGQIALGWTPALTVVNDSQGIFGMIVGSDLDVTGVSEMGPYFVWPGLVGISVHLQAFALTPLAPNGLFQASPGLTITFMP